MHFSDAQGIEFSITINSLASATGRKEMACKKGLNELIRSGFLSRNDQLFKLRVPEDLLNV